MTPDKNPTVFIDFAILASAIVLIGLLFQVSRIGTSEPSSPAIDVAQEAPAEETTVQKAHKKWRAEARGAAAFAVGSESIFGWTSGYNELDAARQDALSWCTEQGGTCEVMDQLKGIEHRAFSTTIAPETLAAWQKYTSGRGFKAFATAPEGFVGFVSDGQSAVIARIQVKQACEAQKKGRAAHLPDRPCVVVFSSRY
jgi:hypothetical protein